MLVVSVARQLGAGTPLLAYYGAPRKPSGAGKRRPGSAKLTMPEPPLTERPGALPRNRKFVDSRRWREMDSNLYGAFPVKWLFLVLASSLFGAGKPFFIPSPAIRFAERAEGVKGPKR
jgi:hypothetical protein